MPANWPCACPRQDPPLPSGGMLLWINGPFGGGKTATAYELNRRLPGSVVCDPTPISRT
jgi:adenylylsulfate kinase-like enzyme